MKKSIVRVTREDGKPAGSRGADLIRSRAARWRLRAVFRPGAAFCCGVLVAVVSGFSGLGQGALVNGGNHVGTITASNPQDTWTFTANEGDSVLLRIGTVTSTNNFLPLIQVYGPDAQLIGSGAAAGDTAKEIALTATNSGTFTVTVADGTYGGSTGTGTYDLHYLKVPGVFTVPIGDEGGAMTNGSNYDGTILIGDLDAWTFTANAGENVILRVGQLSTTNYFNPWLRLYGPDGALIQEGVEAGAVAVEIAITTTNSGTFTVVVADGTYTGVYGTGTYELHYLKVPGDFVVPPGDEGGPMVNGGNYDGTITVGDLDAWTFTANVGDNVLLRVGQLSAASYFNPWLRLYGPDGTLITQGTAAGDIAEEIPFTATNSGTFTVVVADGTYTGVYGTGTYELHYLKVPGSFSVPSGDEGGTMVDGGNYDGTITVGDLDAWTFTANAGENVLLRVGQLSAASYFSPWLRLYGPDGALIQEGVEAGAVGEEIAITTTNSGTFTVVVADGTYTGVYGTGTYELHYLKVPGSLSVPTGDEGGPMVNGGNYDGIITVGDLDAWTFTASIGDAVLVRVGQLTATNYFYSWLRLYGPDGTLIDQGTAAGENAEEVAFTATNSGTFTAVVADGTYTGVYGSGAYEIHLLQVPGNFTVPIGDEGGPMTNGGNYAGAITVGDLDGWTFSANRGDSVVLRLGQLSAASYFNPWMRIYGPDGALVNPGVIAGATDLQINFMPTNSGTFTVVVADGTYTGVYGTGTYELHYLKVPGDFVVPPGDEGGIMMSPGAYGGAIDIGDIDPWTFAACQGDNIALSLKSTNFTGNLQLFGPDGALVKTAGGSTSVNLGYRATNCGPFTVVVSSYASGGSGTYGLTGNVSEALRICNPIISGTNVDLSGVGGPSNTVFVLYTTTNLSTPAPLWTPLYTNSFNQLGVFFYTNLYDPATPQQYFRYILP
jgi:hypothetical protein